MPTCAKDCTAVTDCSLTSWELVFCVCSTGPDDPVAFDDTIHDCNFGGSTEYVDKEAGLQGQWVNTPSLINAPGWINHSRLSASDNSYAQVNISDPCTFSPYAKLTNWGFQIPPQATIRSIVVGVKGFEQIGSASGPSDNNSNGAAVWNEGLVYSGSTYYAFDTNSGPVACDGFDAVFPPHIQGQPTHNHPGDCPEGDHEAGCSNTVPTTTPFSFLFNDQPRNEVVHCRPEQTFLDTDHVYSISGPALKPGFDATFGGGLGKGGAAVITGGKQVWTPAEVNDPSFGFTVSMSSTGAIEQLSIDAFGIGVYYVCPIDNPCPCTGFTTPSATRQPNIFIVI